MRSATLRRSGHGDELLSKILTMRPLYSVLVVCCIALIAHTSFASPSFDCAKASAAVEKLICADRALSDEDLGVAKALSATRQGLGADNDKLVLKEQKLWLSRRTSGVPHPKRCRIVIGRPNS